MRRIMDYYPPGLTITCATHQAAEAHGFRYRADAPKFDRMVELFGRHGCDGWVRDKGRDGSELMAPPIKRCACSCHWHLQG